MKHLLPLFFTLFILNTQAQAPFGLNDPTFNPYDIGNHIGDQVYAAAISDLVELNDGTAVLGGAFDIYNILPINSVIKLNHDGILDTSFSDNIFGVNNYITAIAVQTDGKILVGGEFTSFSGSVSKRLVRLNPDGTLDPSFQSGSGFNAVVKSIEIQDDGKIYCGGEFSVYNNQTTTHGIVRLNPDGTKDNTFINNFVCLYGSIKDFKIQADGKIIGVGDMSVYFANGNTKAVLRINPNGSIDSAFQTNIGTGLSITGEGKMVELDNLGRILIGGSFTEFNGSGTYSNLIRLNTNGTVDNQFQCFGLTNVNDIKFHGPTKNLFVSANFSIVKLDSLGLTIPNWNLLFPSSSINNGTNLKISLKPDHFIAFGVLDDFAEKNRIRFGKWSVDGILDADYSRGYGANNGGINHLKIDSQDRILISGEFLSYNNSFGRAFTRLDRNGSPDTSFHIDIKGSVGDFLIVNDTNYLVYGLFNSVNNYSVSRLVKLKSDGSIDFGFNAGQGGPSDKITAAAIQPDGKIILVGDFDVYNSTLRKRIVRILPDGAVDNSFNVGSGFNNRPLSVVIQSDGKCIISGMFTTYNGVSCAEIIRLNSDGTRDLSFDPGPSPLTNNNFYNKICLQADNKILLSGSFTQFLGVPTNSIIRLNEDGSIDPSFNLPPNNFGYGLGIESCQVSDSAIFIAGQFTYLENQYVGHFAKLNMDGSLNNQFVNHGADSTVFTFDFQSDDKIVIGGDFGLYDNFGKNRIARLFSCTPDWSVDQIISCDPISWIDMNTYSNDTTAYFAFSSSSGCDSVVTLNLDILGPTYSLESQTTCDSYVWPINGQTFMISGQYTDTIPNGAGCDSIITLNLTILNSSNSLTATVCDSFTWPINGQTYTTSGQYTDTILNALGCDSIITLNLIIMHSNTGTDIQTACDSLTWIDGNTYTSSTNTPTFVLQNAAGCDSTVTLNLTIIPSLPLTVSNSFAIPSDANNCTGEVAVTVSGNAPFELDLDNGSQVINSSGYNLVTGLCSGVHDLHITDNCGDTLSVPVVIPVDSNYVFNNPFIDSLAQDSLGVTLTNCDIYYAGIDTAYIDSIWATGNTVNVIWNIVDSNGSNLDTTSYVLNNGNGVYWLQLSVFCPFKSVGEYFTVTEAIYFNNGHVSTAGMTDLENKLFEIYPNPTNDQVHINFSGSNAELTVYDVQGKMVLKDKIQNQEIISLQNFERGVYLFDFKNSNGHSVQRVVKQ